MRIGKLYYGVITVSVVTMCSYMEHVFSVTGDHVAHTMRYNATWPRSAAAYVINLRKSNGRLQHVTGQYAEHGWDRIFGPLQRFEAIDGRNVQLPDFWTRWTETYSTIFTDVNSLGAYGAYASHQNVLKHFLSQPYHLQ